MQSRPPFRVSTRRFSAAAALLLPVALTAPISPASPPSEPAAQAAPVARVDLIDHAMRLLMEGNQRFVDGRSNHPNTDVFRIADTGERGQHPFAAIVTCADSRVPTERLFDRGVGDLFVVRVAGNISDPNQTGSIEYACEHLDTRLVVVMGHTHCGAVKAAVEGADGGPNIRSLLENIVPAVQATRAKHPQLTGEALYAAVVRENVWESIEDMLKGSSIMREKVLRGEVRIVGAVYDVETGRVDWMGSHPAQSGLLLEPAAPVTAAAEPTTEPKAPAASTSTPAGKPAAPSTANSGTPRRVPPAPKPATTEHEAPAHAAHPH